MLIGLDGDDTLWKNEDFFTGIQRDLQAFLNERGLDVEVHDTLLEIENRNVPIYGYGKKSFLLSLFEFVTLKVTGRQQAEVLKFVSERGHWLMRQPAERLPGVEEALAEMVELGDIVVITKGDVAEQTQKFEEAGIEALVANREIVSHKDAPTYSRIIASYRADPAVPFVMIGNSLRSDILPVTQLGHHAIHVPYHVTWAHEHATPQDEHYHRAASLSEAVGILRSIALAQA